MRIQVNAYPKSNSIATQLLQLQRSTAGTVFTFFFSPLNTTFRGYLRSTGQVATAEKYSLIKDVKLF